MLDLILLGRKLYLFIFSKVLLFEIIHYYTKNIKYNYLFYFFKSVEFQ